jgi:hypothetical protein
MSFINVDLTDVHEQEPVEEGNYTLIIAGVS